jgi:4-amino-4-deoxychorismate lyase
VERDPTYRILVNGAPADSVAALDRGLAFGDGVFRTLAVHAGRPLNWARHLERLAADCAVLDLPVPDTATLRAEIGRVAPGDAVAKVIVTRGVSTRGYSLPSSPRTTRIVAAFDLPDPGNAAREGVRVRRCALVLSEQPRLAGVKSLNRLENVLARAEWSDPGIREGLLTDAAGRLIEATAANVFLATGGRLATPRLVRCGVAGAQRARVMALAALAGIACEERDIDFAEIQRADEVFLTNSLIGIWPVVALDERRWEVGGIARRLQSAIAEDDARAS